jgi:hypothetical protein
MLRATTRCAVAAVVPIGMTQSNCEEVKRKSTSDCAGKLMASTDSKIYRDTYAPVVGDSEAKLTSTSTYISKLEAFDIVDDAADIVLLDREFNPVDSTVVTDGAFHLPMLVISQPSKGYPPVTVFSTVRTPGVAARAWPLM